MSEKRTDSNLYTVLFAIGMVIVVGAMLAFTASSLKGRIAENKRVEKQQNILYAMGVNENKGEGDVVFVSASETPKIFDKYIKKQLVIEGDKVSEREKASFLDIKKEQTRAKEGKTRRLPLFVGEKDGETIYIAPIRGKGLWDAVWGYIGVDKNMTIKGVFFDHKGETAGLGANINQRFFMDDFKGESLMGKDRLNGKNVYRGIKILKGNNDAKNERKDDNAVDAIAGATITGNGVSAMIISEMALYVPYFNSLKE